MNRVLRVYLQNEYVGDLIEKNGKNLGFVYTESARIPISLSMPLSETKYHNPIVKPYFENLLPEGELLKLIASSYHVSPNNPFSLLQAIGEDCAGAINLIESETSLENKIAKHFSKQEFLEMIECSYQDIVYYQKGMRLSLAGAQSKTTLILDGEDYYVPNHSHPSTHIIKFDNRRYKDILVNEYFLTRLAQKMNLPVSQIQLKQIEGYRYLLIKRYDRVENKGIVTRVHQEDFCQILGVLSSNKYQTEGGPGFKKIVSVIKEYSQYSAKDIVLLAKIMVFNYLVGNCDYHGKNLSIVHLGNNHYMLAPFYDLVSTVIYDHLSRNNAMSIHKQSLIDEIQKEDLIEELNSWNIKGENILSLIVSDFKNIEEDACKLAQKPEFSAYQETILEITEFIKKQYKKIS